MKNAHERLEKLINHLCEKPKYSFDRILMLDFETFKDAFFHETGNLKQYLTRKAFPIKNERAFELLIHQCQFLVVRWLDKVYLLKAKEKGKLFVSVYELIIEELKKVLSFIHINFENFINPDAKIPEVNLYSFRNNSRYTKLLEHLIKNTLDTELITLISVPIRNFVSQDQSKKITYRSMSYFEKSEALLLSFSGKPSADAIYDKAIIELMVLMNFNGAMMVNHITQLIAKTVSLQDGPDRQFEMLRFFLKEFNQFKEKQGMSYKPQSASLKEQIIKWLNEEIFYIEKHIFSSLKAVESEKVDFDTNKLQLSVSVDVLTLIARAAKDSKLVVSDHNTTVFKTISKYFKTKHVENLSTNSMIKKSYVAERKSKEKAIDALHAMIKKIHEY